MSTTPVKRKWKQQTLYVVHLIPNKKQRPTPPSQPAQPGSGNREVASNRHHSQRHRGEAGPISYVQKIHTTAAATIHPSLCIHPANR
jgi:hypothetical protein